MTEWTGCYQEQWKGVITPGSFTHPAKFAKGLVERILDHMFERGWIRHGDLIGDPFGGVGTGGIIAAYRGYRWVGWELEPKFVKLAEENFEKHLSKLAILGAPFPVIVRGDSRFFDPKVESIVTSPPYVSGGHHADVMDAGNQNGRGQARARAIVTSPPYAGSLDDGGPEKRHPDGFPRSNDWTGYGKTEGQIGRLKSGEVAALVTSPPFTGARSGRGIILEGHNDPTRPSAKDIGARTFQGSGGERESNNIEVLGTGNVTAIVSSPPYADSVNSKSHGIDFTKAKPDYRGRVQTKGRVARHNKAAEDMRYGEDPAQIGALGAVVTSPPWGKNTEGGRRKGKLKGEAVLKSKRGKGASDEAVRAQALRDEEKILGESPGQIGRESGETYWEAMAKVYRACLSSLKPGGYMAIVVKDFVKDKKRMPLCDDTMRLLTWLGFKEVERVHAMLTEETVVDDFFDGQRATKKERKSFFRRLHEGKLPPGDPRRIDFEEVLFVRKPL